MKIVCMDYSAFKLEPVCIVCNVLFFDHFFKFMLNICILTEQQFNKITMYMLPLFLNIKDGRIKDSLTTNVLALFLQLFLCMEEIVKDVYTRREHSTIV